LDYFIRTFGQSLGKREKLLRCHCRQISGGSPLGGYNDKMKVLSFLDLRWTEYSLTILGTSTILLLGQIEK